MRYPLPNLENRRIRLAVRDAFAVARASLRALSRAGRLALAEAG